MSTQMEAAEPRKIDLPALRGGFHLFLASEVVVFVVLAAVRFQLAGSVVSPNANQWLGAGVTAAVLAATLHIWRGLRQIAGTDAHGLDTNFKAAGWYALVSMLLMAYQWSTINLGASSRYGEVFFAGTGFWFAYALFAVLAIWGMRVRGHRIAYTAERHWEVEAAGKFWTLVAAAWVAMYVVLYLI